MGLLIRENFKVRYEGELIENEYKLKIRRSLKCNSINKKIFQ